VKGDCVICDLGPKAVGEASMLRSSGATLRAVARSLGCATNTVRKHFAKCAGGDPGPPAMTSKTKAQYPAVNRAKRAGTSADAASTPAEGKPEPQIQPEAPLEDCPPNKVTQADLSDIRAAGDIAQDFLAVTYDIAHRYRKTKPDLALKAAVAGAKSVYETHALRAVETQLADLRTVMAAMASEPGKARRVAENLTLSAQGLDHLVASGALDADTLATIATRSGTGDQGPQQDPTICPDTGERQRAPTWYRPAGQSGAVEDKKLAPVLVRDAARPDR